MADQAYNLDGQIPRYQRIRRFAIVILLLGIVLAIGGGVMLGIGLKKKHDADNQVCLNPVNSNTCPPLICPSSTSTMVSDSSSSTSSHVHSSSSTKSTTTTPEPQSSCPPCTCPSTSASSTTDNHVPTVQTIPTSTQHIHPIPVLTTKPWSSPRTIAPIGHKTTQQLQTTTHYYPPDPSYYPCLSNIAIAFEAAGDISTNNIYNPQVEFIANHFIANNTMGGSNLTNWNNIGRVTYAAFERSTVHWQKFYHFNQLTDLQKAISSEKQIFGISGYKGVFDVLINNITNHDTQNHFVNTIIFTSNADGTDIYTHSNDARELERRGRLIIVTTVPNIMDNFLPWTNNNRDHIFFLNHTNPGNYGYQAFKIIEQFHCPTATTS